MDQLRRSPMVKHSMLVAAHKTSISLEQEFWHSLRQIAGAEHTTVSGLVTRIDTQRQSGNLSSAIRVFILDYYRVPAREPSYGEVCR